MLPRAALRLAAARPLLSAAPRAPPALWSRGYAKNRAPNSNPSGSAPNSPRRTSPSTSDSTKQAAEFNPKASAEKNTAPQSQPGPGAAAKDATPGEDATASEPQQPKQPLPDLTQGIPSTFEAEFLKSTPESKEKAPEPSLNVTEDPNAEAEAGGRGGGEGGELPKSAYETSTDRRRDRYAKLTGIASILFLASGGLYLARPWESEQEARLYPDIEDGWSPSTLYARAKARLSGSLGYYTEPVFPKLLPQVDPAPPYTLVLSLEDLLIHSEWTREHGWRFAKRPGVDYFLRYLCQYYELVIFTSLPSQAADPVIRKLDPFRIVMWPLFREATRYEKGEYIKDLSYLNRDLSKTIIIDTKAEHVKNQPENAIVLPPWKGEKGDKGLVALIPFLEYIATMGISDVRKAIESFEGKDVATEFALREAKAREAFQKQIGESKNSSSKRGGFGKLAGALGMKPQPAQGSLLVGEETASEGFAKGKMLSDQIRERGQKQYEMMEKEIRENGEKWLKEMAEEEKKAQEEMTKGMKSAVFGVFGGGNSESK
ncbi:putative mitochondrial translocase complex component [Phyllosticta citribraziliensis]|uniref:Mitochondrial import inner membrane translocase subunit TIM50 n=1 Tax=Phyllosticta citribraziliensis TaxID=989973 RepID=A0ABR1LQP8_9PEZI